MDQKTLDAIVKNAANGNVAKRAKVRIVGTKGGREIEIVGQARSAGSVWSIAIMGKKIISTYISKDGGDLLEDTLRGPRAYAKNCTVEVL